MAIEFSLQSQLLLVSSTSLVQRRASKTNGMGLYLGMYDDVHHVKTKHEDI